jgi:ATP-dependent Clp protease ATP-binding subunit ClpA
MLERFTERARRVIALATEEARSRRHGAVVLEHLLIGILRDDGGFAVHVLEQLQVSPETLQAEIERRLSHLPCLPMSGEPTFSPELKAVLGAVLSAKRELAVGPEHLLLSLLAEDGSATTTNPARRRSRPHKATLVCDAGEASPYPGHGGGGQFHRDVEVAGADVNTSQS